MRIPLAWITLCLFCTGTAWGQEDKTKVSSDADKVIEHWLGVAQEIAESQSLAPVDQPTEKFKLAKNAVFRHTQSVRGDDIGALYMWTSQSGRPAAIGVFFAWSQGRNRWVMQEFHSLHDKPIKKTVSGKKTWTSATPGLQWKPTADLPAPTGGKNRLKLLAKRFPKLLRVSTRSSNDQTWQLRVVPSPIYEYSDEASGIDYGAIFVLCQGTDTELIVAVESRSENEQRQWYYALAPFSDYEITVKLPSGDTWTSPDGSLGEDGKPHFWDYVEQRPKPDFEK